MNKFENNSPKDPSRRDFLGKVVGGALAVGLASTVGINKYMEEEKLNTLYTSFKGQEKNFGKAKEAAEMLRDEMVKNNIKAVKLSGTGHENNHIEILRTFLTSHIDSQTGNKYPFKNSLIIGGYYTKENLEAIIKKASVLSGNALDEKK
jgi:hypothetical protein